MTVPVQTVLVSTALVRQMLRQAQGRRPRRSGGLTCAFFCLLSIMVGCQSMTTSRAVQLPEAQARELAEARRALKEVCK